MTKPQLQQESYKTWGKLMEFGMFVAHRSDVNWSRTIYWWLLEIQLWKAPTKKFCISLLYKFSRKGPFYTKNDQLSPAQNSLISSKFRNVKKVNVNEFDSWEETVFSLYTFLDVVKNVAKSERANHKILPLDVSQVPDRYQGDCCIQRF